MSSTTDNEQRFAYLLSPEFQIVNTAGKPLTGGWIEVYIHGTRVKYYCFSDFDGTLHPFQIPLDSLGSNIVLASPTHAYDIYIYNKFGSLVMSRYNVVPACNAADIVEDVVVIDSPDETINVACDGGSNWHLEVNTDLIATASGLAEVSGALTEVSGALLNKKDKQEPIDVSGSVTKTVTNIKQNENGEIEITYEDIDLPQQVPNVDIVSPSGTLDITSTIDTATNTKTFKIDVHKSNMDYFEGYYGRARYEDRPSDTVAAFTTYVDQWREYRYQGDFITNSWQDQDNTTFLLNSGLYLITASIRYKMTDASVKNKEEYIRIATGAFNGLENGTQLKDWSNEAALDENTIQLSFVRSVDDDEDYDNLRGNHTLYFAPYLPYGVNYAEIDHLQIVKLDSIVTYHGGPGPMYKPGYGIEIQDDVISVATGTVVTNNYFNTVVSSINNEINEINTTIQNVTGDITELSEIVTNIVGVTGDLVNRDEFNVVTGDIVNLSESVTNLIGATGDYATKDYVDEAVSGLENYSAGQYISIEDHVINVTGVQPEGDYATNADLQTVSAAIPESEEVEFEELDVDSLATTEYVDNRIASAAGDVYEAGQYISIEDGVIAATGLQPAGDYATEQYVDDAVAAVTGQPITQVNSDWLATSGVAEILNKPDVFQLIAGDNIDITPSGNDLVISASSDVTKAYVDEQIDAATGMIPTLPAEEEVEFEELNLSDYALASAIPDVSNFVTQQDIDDSIAPVQSQVDTLVAATGDYLQSSDLDRYATEQYVNDAIDAATGMIPDVSNFATNDDVQYVQEQVDQLVAATGYYLQASDLAGYATEQELQAVADSIPDISNLATKSEVDAAIDTVSAAIPAEEEVEFEELNLSAYALASAIPDISNLATKTELATVEAEIPDISDLATKSELEAVEAEIPDVSTLATKTELATVDAKVDAVSAAIPSEEEVEFEELDLSDYALASAIPDVSNLATKSELDAVEAEIPDVSNLATKTEVQAVDTKVDTVSASIPEAKEIEFKEVDLADFALASAVPQLELNSDNQVTAIDGHALVGGGESNVYTAGSGINITDDVISIDNPVNLVAGDNVNITVSGNDVVISAQGGSSTYTAGNGIDIVNDTISVDNTVAMKTDIPDVTNLATKAEVQAATGMIPDTTDMATQTWVGQQGYLTAVPSTYATNDYVDTAVGTKQNTLTGITDVQVVQSLPASPVATVLYLIPEA